LVKWWYSKSYFSVVILCVHFGKSLCSHLTSQFISFFVLFEIFRIDFFWSVLGTRHWNLSWICICKCARHETLSFILYSLCARHETQQSFPSHPEERRFLTPSGNKWIAVYKLCMQNIRQWINTALSDIWFMLCCFQF
jgi:hypothetical protein